MTTNHMAIRRFSFIGHFRIRYYCITNIYLNLSIYFNALLGRLDIQTMLKRSTDWNVWEAIFFGCDHIIQHVYIWKLRFLYARFKFKKKLSVSAKKNPFCTLFRHKISKQMRNNAKHEHLVKLQNFTKVLIDRAIQTIPNHWYRLLHNVYQPLKD